MALWAQCCIPKINDVGICEEVGGDRTPEDVIPGRWDAPVQPRTARCPGCEGTRVLGIRCLSRFRLRHDDFLIAAGQLTINLYYDLLPGFRCDGAIHNRKRLSGPKEQ